MADNSSHPVPTDAPPHGCRRLDAHPLLGPLPPPADVEFTIQGRPITGRAGEPILVALLAAGIRVCRTMPRSGEARGGYCLADRCSDCLMQVDGEPNVRTCVTPLRPGMRVETQHGPGRWAGALTTSGPGSEGTA